MLLTEYIKILPLQRHTIAVEAVMRHFAKFNNEDPEVWGVVGLLHDLNYEKYLLKRNSRTGPLRQVSTER